MKGNRILCVRNNGSIETIESFPKLEIHCLKNNSLVLIHESVLIRKRLYIRVGNNAFVNIDKDVEVNNVTANLADDKGTLSIGEGTAIGGASINVNNEPNLEVIIGKKCLFSTGIIIRACDGHTIFDMDAPSIAINPPRFGCHIGEHVWVGQNAVLLKDARIPDNCIVGAGSVVSRKKYSPHSIIAGNPAKTIRTNISWDRSSIHEYLQQQDV